MREWSSFAEKNPEIRLIMRGLPHLVHVADVRHYTDAVRILGRYIGRAAEEVLVRDPLNSVRVAGHVNDADTLIHGVLSYFEDADIPTKMSCFWTTDLTYNLSQEPLPIITKVYQEELSRSESVVILVTPILNTYTSIRPILTKMLSQDSVQKLIVAAPILLRSAQNELYRRIPADIGEKVELVHFALDDLESVWPYPVDGIANTAPTIVKARRYIRNVTDHPVR